MGLRGGRDKLFRQFGCSDGEAGAVRRDIFFLAASRKTRSQSSGQLVAERYLVLNSAPRTLSIGSGQTWIENELS